MIRPKTKEIMPPIFSSDIKRTLLQEYNGTSGLYQAYSQRPDSNRRPAVYETAALPTELRWRKTFRSDYSEKTRTVNASLLMKFSTLLEQ
jgi:hypothetical protein